MQKKTAVSIFFLALGIFGAITTEIGMIAVLPQLSRRFDVDPSQAGYLVSLFALVVAVSGPFLTLLFSGMNRKKVLLAAMLMFAVSNVVYAYAESFELMLVFRVLPALFHPLFFSIAITSAAGLVPPAQIRKAVTRVMAGVTFGFAFGVPLTAYLAARFSLEAAFLFGASVTAVAFAGILTVMPSMPGGPRVSFGKQLGVLRRPAVWLSLAIVVMIFTAMSSVYSYFAEYLNEVTRMGASLISAMLMVFGIAMIAGNFLFGFWLSKSVSRTALWFPAAYAIVYAMLHYGGVRSESLAVIVVVWGCVHAGGLLVGQALLTSDTAEAPEFGNSLFVSFSNIGITLGTWIGGLFIAGWGTPQLAWSGMLASLLALALIAFRMSVIRKFR